MQFDNSFIYIYNRHVYIFRFGVMHVTLKELRYFIAVYQEQSIAKAAEKLFVVPSVVSSAIKNLENEFHIALFTRTANRIAPTAAGEQFYKRALDVITSVSMLEHTMQTLNTIPVAQKTRCRIGMSASLLSICGEELDCALSKAFPDYLFFIESYPTIDEPDFYKKYDITIALTYLGRSFKTIEHKNSGYAVEHLRTFQPYIWLSESSPLCIHDEITYEMLKDYNFVSYNGFVNFSYHPEFYLTEDRFWEVKLKNQLINSLETFPCYTSDYPLKHGKLVFEDLFKGHPIKAKKIHDITSIELIYKKDYTANFIALIASTFSNLLFSE